MRAREECQARSDVMGLEIKLSELKTINHRNDFGTRWKRCNSARLPCATPVVIRGLNMALLAGIATLGWYTMVAQVTPRSDLVTIDRISLQLVCISETFVCMSVLRGP